MTPVVLLGILVAAPIFLLMLLRINAAIIFLSLCLGSVLVQYVAPDAGSLLWMFSGRIDPNNTPLLSLALLIAPVAFTMLVMIRTVRGSVRMFLNLLPSAATGIVLAVMAVPLLPEGMREPITATPAWLQLEKSQTLAVAVGALLSMLVLWIQRPKAGQAGEKKHVK